MRIWTGMLAAALLGLGGVRAQGPSLGSNEPGNVAPIASSNNSATLPQPTAPLAEGASTTPAVVDGAMNTSPYPPGISDWLAYRRPVNCCSPLFRDGPIRTELFSRAGVSFAIGGSIPGKTMSPGIMIQGGGRALFFTPKQDMAFTVELGISSVWYDAGWDRVATMRDVKRVRRAGQGGEVVNGRVFQEGQVITDADGIPLIQNIPELDVIPSSMNQTYVHLGIGHEVYMSGWPDPTDDFCKWRIGYDLGGRWGSSKMILVKQPFEGDQGNPNRDLFNHRNDVVGGPYFAIHTDAEMPLGGCVFLVGVRTEFSYIFADLLQPQLNTDTMQINVLANFGVRF
ncbi:MAG: hypothetical protein U0840_01395 [Gemmataceae bacterium]